MEKVFISACFIGENVKYNGGHQALLSESLLYKTIERWKEENRLLSGCPECLGGLPTPRDPAEIQLTSNKIITVNNVDVTHNFNMGALKTLELCLRENIKFALLKESSPSCGSQKIYDGSFSKTKVAGEGVTTRLLREHKIKVFSEETISELIIEIEG